MAVDKDHLIPPEAGFLSPFDTGFCNLVTLVTEDPLGAAGEVAGGVVESACDLVSGVFDLFDW
jgi:hypothetical protein